MVNSGAIDTATAEKAKTAPVRIDNALEIKETFGLYFKERIRRELVERFGWQRVYQGGLRVFDDRQRLAARPRKSSSRDELQDIEKRSGFKHPKRVPAPPNAARHQRSQLSSGRAHGDGSVERPCQSSWSAGVTSTRVTSIAATQAKRQSGSAFKPFVYAAALEAGYSPASLISGLNFASPDRPGRVAARGRSQQRR